MGEGWPTMLLRVFALYPVFVSMWGPARRCRLSNVALAAVPVLCMVFDCTCLGLLQADT